MAKNFRSIPEFIFTELEKISGDEIKVACARKIEESDIIAGKFNHLNISLQDGKLTFPSRIIPAPRNGRFSTINREGREIVRDDLPMVPKTFPVESPNFGDWSKGSHTNYMKRDVYLRDFISPKHLQISTQLLGEEKSKSKCYLFKFEIDEVLDRKDQKFEGDLFNSINLLQENAGAVAVYAADARLTDYLQSLRIAWEILPPGEGERNIARILSGVRNATEEVIVNVRDRYNFLETLRPIAIVNGTSGFQRYFGAKFSDNLVVFENLHYGNAVYVMYENWEELSQRSRTELLSGTNENFDRVIHGPNWKGKVKALVRGKLRGKF